jgi:hypothetical protein
MTTKGASTQPQLQALTASRHMRGAADGCEDPSRCWRHARLLGLAQGFLRACIRGRLAEEPLVPPERGGRGPQCDGLGAAPGRGAQVPAVLQAIEQLKALAGPR